MSITFSIAHTAETTFIGESTPRRIWSSFTGAERKELQAEDLERASELIKEEFQVVREVAGYDGSADKELEELWNAAFKEWIYSPSTKRYSRIASATNSDKVESLRVSLEIIVCPVLFFLLLLGGPRGGWCDTSGC